MSDPTYNIEFFAGEVYCTVLCTGKFSEKAFHDMVERMRDHRAGAGPKVKYLVDIRRTSYHFDNFARFRIAEGAAVLLPNLRVSVLGNSGVVDKITENTAFNRGMLILVTDNEAEAVLWLEK